ncbi:hypothetical protein [Pelistega sp. MC2]|uniref:hypothetical protein n=1 Tax=Pelistega sp. MC2 TaxID=1720297 RepID=UPI0015A25C00|nr:hypothetical protein [Pelistega sp. MC2]
MNKDFWDECKRQEIPSYIKLMELLNDELFLQTEKGQQLAVALRASFEHNVLQK